MRIFIARAADWNGRRNLRHQSSSDEEEEAAGGLSYGARDVLQTPGGKCSPERWARLSTPLQCLFVSVYAIIDISIEHDKEDTVVISQPSDYAVVEYPCSPLTPPSARCCSSVLLSACTHMVPRVMRHWTL